MNESPRKAIILGASSGIGKSLALQLAQHGWKVAVTGRREALLSETAAAAPGRIVAQVLDVNDTDSLHTRLGNLVRRLEGLDLLVISAGTGFLNDALDSGPELETVRTNVAAFTSAADWAYAFFKQQGHGQLAAITSVAGLTSEAAAPAYAASKAYQILYLDALAKKSKKEKNGIAVTELRPGFVDTAMMKGEGHFWVSTADAAARLACQAILKKKRLRYISRHWSLIGTLLRLFAVFS